MLMLFDRSVVQTAPAELSAEQFLADGEARFGGFDAVVLWHAYPRIGLDERNQFDLYRQVPGGIPGLRRLVGSIQQRGTRVLLAYYPWDVGTRREPAGEAVAMARLVADCGADGVFLDTMAESTHELQARLEEVQPGAVLVPEALVPLRRLADHAMSWLQWPPQEERPYVLRNMWFEPRHRHHLVRRWHTDHSDELRLAWLNGAGMVVWENVFGSINPWRDEDAATLRSMRPFQRHLGPLLADAAWSPFVRSYDADVYASSWSCDGWQLVTLANTGRRRVRGPLVRLGAAPQAADRAVDVVAGRPAGLVRLDGELVLAGELAPGALGAVAVVAGDALADELAALARAGRRPAGGGRAWGSVAPAVRRPPAGATPAAAAGPPASSVAPVDAAGRGEAPAGMVRLGPVRRRLITRYRLRECGMDGPAPLLGSVYPELHATVEEAGEVELGPYLLDLRPVTNAEFARFLSESGYRPAAPDNFLAHWDTGGGPAPGQHGDPVVFVDLDDVRAFAAWRGARLPTPAEWQHGLEGGGAGYGSRRVWEWTDSERDDGHTRWCVLKAGCDFESAGSDWYLDGGEREPDWAVKLLRAWPGLDRSSSVGFRCASSAR